MNLIDPGNLCFNCMSILRTKNGVCVRCGKDNRFRKSEEGLISNYILNGRYYLGRKLGRGGFGVTYIGYDLKLQRVIAVKEFFPMENAYRAKDGVTICSTVQGAQMFRYGLRKAVEEGRKVALIDGIPNAVHLYDCMELNGTFYLVMEYVDGVTLRQYVQKKGPLSMNEAYALLRPLTITLDRMHEMSIIHRDISPDNIMVRSDTGSAVLLDFGAARIIENDVAKTGTVTVRHGYAPVEQYGRRAQLDGRSDEYALCATMYYALTDRNPVPSLDRLRYPLPTPRELESSVSAAFERVLLRGMSVNVDDRYTSITELRSAFDETFGQKSNDGGRDSSAKGKAGRKKRIIITTAAISLALLLIMLSVLLIAGNSKGNGRWECPECKAWNNPTEQYCGNCGIQMGCTATPVITETPEPSATPDTRWECLECGNMNEADSVYCGKCSLMAGCTATPIPDQTDEPTEMPTQTPDARWKCLACETMNDGTSKYCAECGIMSGNTATPAPTVTPAATPDTRWECLECGKLNDADSGYCGNCSVMIGCTATPIPTPTPLLTSTPEITWECLVCGRQNAFSTAYCEECGAKLGQTPEPITTTESISNYSGILFASASSEYRNNNRSILVGAGQAIDSDLDTAWNSNKNWKDEWIEVSVANNRQYRISGLRIANGYWKSDKVYYENTRIRKMEVSANGSVVGVYDLEDERYMWQVITFDEPIETNSLRITILDVYTGTDFKDCAITEIELF